MTCQKKAVVQPTHPLFILPAEGIVGKILFKEGNFNSDGEITDEGRIYGVQREILVFELTNLKDVEIGDGDFVNYISTNPVDTIFSDYHGSFVIGGLQEGVYSLFIKENDRLYGKLGDGDNFFPVRYQKDSVNKIMIEIDYLANY
ncbi:MAG: hypothetical protein MUF42_00205 [Cytophagaceae bacterium]|jgi:hypothetical protein|nr:hypothetical protein [Cytophagaceae bacterium]